MVEGSTFDIVRDDLTNLNSQGFPFVTFGEVMIRDTPADNERPERTRRISISLAGSELNLAIGLSRLGIHSSYITRVPDNPYGHSVRNLARENGVNVDHIVWAPKTEPIGRYIYEFGCTPRKSIVTYQRMYSAASRLGPGMVDWATALKGAGLFHTSGITFGLAAHSGYDQNYCYESFMEAISCLRKDSDIGLDFNYRGSLWSREEARKVMSPILGDHVSILITTIEDMAGLYDMHCGPYSARAIADGEMGPLDDAAIRDFAGRLIKEFDVKMVGITIRYPDTFEQNRWESAAADAEGNFYRSPEVRSITLRDRLGGGDAWNAGFYYGLLTSTSSAEKLEKGVLVGDATTRLKQTIMFDLPVIDKREVQALLKEDLEGGGKRTVR